MSYKLDLSALAGLDRSEHGGVTRQLADFFVDAIDGGRLEPGDQLPPTRELAAAADVNHLTAARVYRRLAELGYVTASVGRGTFVSARAAAAAETGDGEWQSYVLPERRVSYAAEVLQDQFRTAQQDDIISLAVGWPTPRLYPVRELRAISDEVFADAGGEALGYLSAEGLPELREELARRGAAAGFATSPEEIIVTSGARQGLDLVARAVLGPDDVAVVESPTFTGLLTSLEDTGARVIGIPVDEDGFDVDALERVLARHEVKLCALQPACHNPTGRDLVGPRRERLLELAQERSFFVLEDAVYATLRYEGTEPQRLRAGAPAHVVYVDSLSKTVGGGLRIGWIAARGPIRGRLAALKMAADVHTSSLDQHIAARYLAAGHHDRQLERALPYYRERRDALMAALERHLAGEWRATTPAGGHHVWVTLNRPVPERALYNEALRHGMTFTPGGATMVEPGPQTSLRLSFGLLDPDELDEGVRRLAVALRAVRRYDRLAATAPLS
jgi:DNA-binding transcriptional MocR family regulator